MRQSLRIAVLLTCACSLAHASRTLPSPSYNYLAPKIAANHPFCADELKMVQCGIRASLPKVEDRIFHEQCCSGAEAKYVAGSPVHTQAAGMQATTPRRYSEQPISSSSSSSSGSVPHQHTAAAPATTAAAGPTKRTTVHERSSAAADAQETDETMKALRPDLDLDGPLVEQQPNFFYGICTRMQQASVPFFPGTSSSIQIKQQKVPQRLTKPVIRQTKAYAINHLRTTSFRGYGALAQNLTSQETAKVQQTYYELRAVSPVSGFVHPGCVVGPAELALMKERLAGDAKLQELAVKSLLTGSGVPPKVIRQSNGVRIQSYVVPTDTPLKYAGPFPMRAVDTRYNGITANASDCPNNYPSGAPLSSCGHVSLVELDAQQTYKQAMAYWATGNAEYAKTALNIIEAWASDNQVFGLATENGPLEAGWSVASFARALELLRGEVDGWDHTYGLFKAWVDRLLLPLMDTYVNSTDLVIKEGKPNVLGNWHSTIAEAWMSVGILSDDRARYNKAVELYQATVKDYFKWGRGKYRNYSGVLRVVGEATETLRDIYHTQFGLGGLLQTAEMAWQQDEDLYSSHGYALVAAMEMQAKIILAHNVTTNLDDESALPAGFKLVSSMPPAPANCTWKFDIQKQLWTAVDNETWVSDLKDGVKYIAGNGYLPSGWELGYNHYVGRLGMQLPQTTALLQRHNIEWYSMHFGLGTLSHANTAALLWRTGLKKVNVCRGKPKLIEQIKHRQQQKQAEQNHAKKQPLQPQQKQQKQTARQDQKKAPVHQQQKPKPT